MRDTQALQTERAVTKLVESRPIPLADFRLARDVELILALGPRPIIELLIELGEQRLCRTYLEQCVRRYSEIDPEHLAALGGDTPRDRRRLAHYRVRASRNRAWPHR